MSTREHANEPGEGLPEPPFDPVLIADLHAGVLPRDVAVHVEARLPEDPAARATLDALTHTQRVLRHSPPPSHPMPATAHSSTDRTLAGIRSVVEGRSSPARGRRARLLVGLTAAACVVAAALIVSIWQLARPSLRPAPVATPSHASQVPTSLSSTELTSAYSVLGTTDGRPFTSIAALRRCTAANGVADTTVVVGSGTTVYRDQPAVVILLSTGSAGRFDALVVADDCNSGNPATLARARIGP